MVKKKCFFLWRIFSPENRHRHRHRHRHMHSHRYCICIGKFCKQYLPLQNPKKKILFAHENYLLLYYYITILLSDKGSHRNSVPLFKNCMIFLWFWLIFCLPDPFHETDPIGSGSETLLLIVPLSSWSRSLWPPPRFWGTPPSPAMLSPPRPESQGLP